MTRAPAETSDLPITSSLPATTGLPITTGGTRSRAGRISHWWTFVRWYLREVSGEAEYQRYLDSFAELHGCGRPVRRAEFERRRMAAKERSLTNRCC